MDPKNENLENQRQAARWDRVMSNWTDDEWAIAIEYAATHLGASR